MSAPRLELPDPYNAATTFVDDNVTAGRGERTAILHEDQRFTYRQVQEAVNRAGNGFRGLGLDTEQRVLLVLPDCPQFAFSFFGAIKIGAVPIPVNPWMKAGDYEYLLNDSRARIVVVHESALPEIEAIGERPRHLRHVVV
ncbi:MAG: AMP-binding protein, partial [Deltaproteobacteria bacterium]|nr:AMP-binding protein [Deltaproteobacteria bacterium]